MSAFARAASQATSSTGAWTAAVTSLSSSLGRVETIEKKQAADINRTLSLYQKMGSAVGGYASALSKLEKVEGTNTQNEKKFSQALQNLGGQLSKIDGLSSKEATRLGRTVELYTKLAKAVDTYASALLKMESLGSKAASDQQKQEAAAQRNEAQQQKLAQSEARLAQAQQRLDQTAQRLAQSEERMAQGTRDADSAFNHFSSSTFALRSTLGELEQTYQSVLHAFEAIPAASAAAAISQESAFAQVARVVGDADAATNNLFQGLQKISTDLPIDFEATAKIAQLGAQIGITADQLIQFTRVVAAFSITTGISADTATILIGQIAEMENLPVTEFENFASAVLYLGTVSAATEEEILNINDSIATVSTVFGLSTQATLGLSAAFATLRIRPELARGSLTRVFGQLEDAVDGSGHALDTLSTIMGLTTAQVKTLRETDPDQFFLRFIAGLKNAADSGVSFRSSLRDLGITAVRDIDTISRLGNNFDVLSDAVNNSYAEYAKNTELTRQSQRIFDTTANRIGNLKDAFQNFLANAGKPLAAFVGILAKAGSTILDFVNQVPQVGFVIGGVASLVTIAGTAWIAYRLVLIKTLTSLIAMREAQHNLGTSSVNLATVMQVLNQEQTEAAVTSVAATQAFNNQARSNGVLATSMAQAAAGAQGLAIAEEELSVTSAALVGAERAVASTAAGAVPEFELLAGATFASADALAAHAVAAKAALGPQLQVQISAATTATAMTAEAAATDAAAISTTAAGRSMGAAALAAGPWIAGLALVGTAAAYLIPAMLNSKSSVEKLTKSAIDSAGGLGNLAQAIEDDTDAAAKGGPVYRTVTVHVNDLTAATVKAAKANISNAKAQINAIELVHGSVDELKKQAAGQGTAATAAKAYVAQIENASKTIESNTKLLESNTVVLGDNAKKWIENAFDAATAASGITKNANALNALRKTGISLGDVLTTALSNPKKATNDLSSAIASLNQQLKDSEAAEQYAQIIGNSGKAEIQQQKDIKKSITFLEALQGTIKDTGDEASATAVKQQLLGDKMEQTPTQAALAAQGFGDVATALQALGDGADASEDDLTNLQQTIAGFGTPLDAFKAAFDDATSSATDSADTAADALSAFSDSATVSLADYEKQLDKILNAQANWAANLVILAQRLGPDIASELANHGPEAAPMIQKFVDASDAELQKLKPKLTATTADATTALASTILAAIPDIQGASKKTATVISDALRNQLIAGKVPFEDTLNDYARLVQALSDVKGKPAVELQTADAKKSLDDLLKLVKGTSASGELDPKGTAHLNDQIFNDKKNSLIDQTSKDSKSGLFDPKGTAQLNPQIFNDKKNALKSALVTESARGLFDPKGKAQLNTNTFYTQMANLRTSSKNTGEIIQANLTRSATVTVGYTYKANNSPPSIPKTIAAADGGWITGPGGPRDDRVAMLGSNGEFMVNAAAASQYGPLLESINKMGGQGGGSAKEAIAGAAGRAGAVPMGGSVSAPTRAAALTSNQPGRPQTLIHVTNYYPQAEPTSTTVNRSLAFAAQLDGTL
jgi:TP901 family phage tail tape measure protein